jgi:hypothetical protein
MLTAVSRVAHPIASTNTLPSIRHELSVVGVKMGADASEEDHAVGYCVKHLCFMHLLVATDPLLALEEVVSEFSDLFDGSEDRVFDDVSRKVSRYPLISLSLHH